TSSSSSSRAATSNRARSSPPTVRSSSGTRCSPTLPASSPSSIASFIMPRSTDSMGTPTGARRRKSALLLGLPSGGGPSHDPTIRSLYLVTIPDRWTPEQPLAVVEFIGDSRQAVGALYGWRPSPWWPRASSTYRCRLSPTILCAVRFHKYVAS